MNESQTEFPMTRGPLLYVSARVVSVPALRGLIAAHAPCRTFDAAEDIEGLPGGCVVLATPAEIEVTLRREDQAGGAMRSVCLIWCHPQDLLDSALRVHPQVAGVLDANASQDSLYAAFNTALRLAAQTQDRMAARKFEQVLEIGRALASEKDLDTLLDLILTHARDLTAADGGSIYTLDANGKLCFRLWQNASTRITANVQKTLVGDYSVAGYVARTGEVVMVEDAYRIPDAMPYGFNPASDRALNYRTGSLLTVPLRNKRDETVGVLQLINRKINPEILLNEPGDFTRYVLPFDRQSRSVALALAGQAGVALENRMLYADIESLFEGFIKASVQAIEARDPTTAGHSFRVADFTERLAVAVDRTEAHGLRDVVLTRAQMRELRYAALLHDFGKVGVREQVLVKAKKLYPDRLERLQERFRSARACLEANAYRRLLDVIEQGALDREDIAARRRLLERELGAERERLRELWRIVARANEPTVSPQDLSADLAAILEFSFPDEDGADSQLLRDFEFADLGLSQGNLNLDERREIESHVSHTYSFLSLIPWTKNLAALPDIAYAHHEKLDGSGYPRGLRGDQIPLQSRMMTIADIYDALTAGDRPYKRGLPEAQALDILEHEAKSEKIDGRIFRIFVEAGAYRLQRPP